MKQNSCPRCNYDAEQRYFMFFCLGCGLQFTDGPETGPVPVQCEFEEGIIYNGQRWANGIKVPVVLLVKKRQKSTVKGLLVSGSFCGKIELKLKKFKQTEFVQPQCGGLIFACNQGW